MGKPSGLRRVGSLVVAVAVHVAFLSAIWPHHDLVPPVAPVMEVTLVPPLPPAPSPPAVTQVRRNRAPKPKPTLLHRPPPEALQGAAPRAAAPPAAVSAAPDQKWRVQKEPPGEAPQRLLRKQVGCQDADFLALSKEERAACNQQLAKGAKDAKPYNVVSPKLRKQFDGEFECPKDDAWCEYRMGKGPYPGLFAPRHKARKDWD